MNAALAIAAALLVVTLLASWRTGRQCREGRVWRILAQWIMAALLFLVLSPPHRSVSEESLVVLTPNVTEAQRGMLDRTSRTVRLPGVADDGTSEAVPDLATSLRRHPGTRRLHVLGSGLPARDREAARKLYLSFDPSPSPVGIAELIAATEVTAGSIWRVHGRVSAVESGSLELVDRAGEIVSRSTLDSEGRFVFDAALRTAGISRFVMRVVAADGQVIEQMPVEVVVRNGDRLRVLLIAGAPDAELKYLRRWAVDAGVEFGVRMAVSRGIALRDGIDRLDAESLGKSDLLIADERSWSALSVLEKNAVREAVGQGLGLLLRVTGPVPASVRSEWAALGLRVDAADIERTITLPALEGGLGAALELARRPLSVVGDDVASLLVTNEGTSLALWRAQGRGRIAVWWLADSYRLVLGGNAQRFGTLWSGAMRTIARADAPSITKLSQRAWIGQRSVICGIGDDTTVEASDHTRTVLRIDPHTPGCAAFWPVLAGWHRVADGEAGVTFFVHDAQQAPALAHADTVLATQRVVLAARAGASAAATKPAPRWPFFLAWLLVAAVVWWSERKQHS